jgi:hypothetical protein
LDECLRQSTGSGLNIPTAEKYFRDWLDAKEQVGRTSASTLTRYAPILERFVAFLPDIRRRSPLAPQKTAKRKKGTDKNTVVDLHQDLMTYFGGLTVSGNSNAPIFPELNRRPVGSTNGLSARFRRLMDKAGIYAPLGAAKGEDGRVFRALSFHSLRHAFVTQLHCTWN